MEQMTRTHVGRRRFLALGGAAAGGAILAACGGEASPTAAVSAGGTMPVPAQPTLAATVAATSASSPAPAGATSAAPAMPTAAVTAATGNTAGGTATRPATAAAKVETGYTTPVPQATPDATGRILSTVENVPDAFTKVPPPFKSVAMIPGKGGKVSALIVATGTPVTPRGQNKYWQELEKRMGLSMFDAQLVPSGMPYAEKIAAVVAGGDIPDITYIDTGLAPDLFRAIQQGAFTDLTPYLTGDGLKEFPNLAKLPPFVWKNSVINGKLYGVPRSRFLVGNPLMIRLDWMEKVGLTNPKNADDLLDLLVRFTKGDPDGNGSQDTYGLSSATPSVFSSLLFEQMFRVPHTWRKNADGTLTYFLETEEFKQAVAFQRKAYEAGVWHPDTATATDMKMKDLFVSGKVGGYMDTVTGLPSSGGRRFQTTKINPKAKVIEIIMPGWDGGNPTINNSPGFFGFAGIPSKVGRDRERTKELLRILDWQVSPFGSEEWRFKNYGLEGVHHTANADGTLTLTDQGRSDISDLGGSMNNHPQVFFYDIPTDGPDLQLLVNKVIAVGQDNPVVTLFSPTNAQKAGELMQLRIDRQTAIVTGREPLSALDGWVKDWRSRGGDTIRKEYQDALKG